MTEEEREEEGKGAEEVRRRRLEEKKKRMEQVKRKAATVAPVIPSDLLFDPSTAFSLHKPQRPSTAFTSSTSASTSSSLSARRSRPSRPSFSRASIRLSSHYRTQLRHHLDNMNQRRSDGVLREAGLDLDEAEGAGEMPSARSARTRVNLARPR